ncbi:MAG: Fur family transcriptional regulator [Armatimonadota bacterium]|nr:Fur family transcriptional regulator [Fimbriimonadaceae bacterium]
MHPVTQQRLRQTGLRLTQPRLTVLDVLEKEGKHREAEFIWRAAQHRLPTLARQSVYDNLNALVAAGIVRRIEPAGSPALYETRAGDNHHHLVCRRCYTAVDVDCHVGHAPCLEPMATHGFAIDEAEVIFWGICPQCQSNQPKETNP